MGRQTPKTKPVFSRFANMCAARCMHAGSWNPVASVGSLAALLALASPPAPLAPAWTHSHLDLSWCWCFLLSGPGLFRIRIYFQSVWFSQTYNVI